MEAVTISLGFRILVACFGIFVVCLLACFYYAFAPGNNPYRAMFVYEAGETILKGGFLSLIFCGFTQLISILCEVYKNV